MLTNVALASFGSRVMADSFAPWYRTWPVNDGKRNEIDETGRWGKVRWLSAPTPEPHWLQVLFPGPQGLSRVEIHWARDSGRFLMPRDYWLEVWEAGGWTRLPELSRAEEPDGRVTVIDLALTVVARLRLYMPAGGGKVGGQENVLGVAELEAYSPTPAQGEPSSVVVLPVQLKSRANPFFLNWAPVPGAAAYLVEYSQDAGFAPAVTQQVPVAANYHTPDAPLAPGRWYWRVAPAPAEAPDGAGAWSEPGVVDLEPGFTYIPGAQADWKATHPRLPWADIDRQALLAQAEGPKREIWAQLLKATADAVPHVAQIRNMQDAGDASGELPAEPPGFPDGYWTIERWREIVAAGAKVTEAVTLHSFVYALSGSAQSRETARRWLLHGAAWDPEGSTGIDSVDHAAHDVMIGLAAGYDALYHDLSPEERERVRGAIVGRCRALWRYLNPFDNDPNNNHPWFQTTALAVGALAVWDEVPEARQWADFAVQLYVGRFISLGGADGEWHEGSDYWTYSLGFVFDFCDVVRQVTGVDLYRHPWLRSTARFKLYVAPPGGPGLSLGDTHKHVPNGEDAAQMLCLAAANGDSAAQWYGLEALKGADLKRPGLLLRLMLWWEPDLAPQRPGELPLGVLFREAGFIFLHTTLEDQKGSHLAMRCGKFHGLSGGHSHADQNHFMLYAGGEPLVLDSGCYDYYGSPHFNGWFIRTRAHNTVLVDGQEQVCQRAGADGHVRAFLHSAAYDYVRGDASAPGVYGGKLDRFDRHVLFLRPAAEGEMGLFVLFDDLAAPEPAAFDWLLHTSALPEMESHGQTVRLSVARPGANLSVTLRAGTAVTAAVAQGFPEGLVPTRTIPEEWHVTFTTQERSARQTFLTVLDPHHPTAVAARVDELSDRSVRISRGSETHSVWFGHPPAGCDASVLAITEKDGACVRLLAAGATRVAVAGKTVLEAEFPVTLSWWTEPGGGLHCAVQSPVSQAVTLQRNRLPVAAGTSQIRVGGYSICE